MINKVTESLAQAFSGIQDGAVVMIGGFGGSGIPHELIEGLVAQNAKDLVIITNNAGSGETGIAALLKSRRVRKIICSYPRMANSHIFETLYRSKEIELELTLFYPLRLKLLQKHLLSLIFPNEFLSKKIDL